MRLFGGLLRAALSVLRLSLSASLDAGVRRAAARSLGCFGFGVSCCAPVLQQSA